jgi:hypothetical protein
MTFGRLRNVTTVAVPASLLYRIVIRYIIFPVAAFVFNVVHECLLAPAEL